MKKLETLVKKVEVCYYEIIDHDDVETPRKIKVVTETTKWFPNTTETYHNPVKSTSSEYI